MPKTEVDAAFPPGMIQRRAPSLAVRHMIVIYRLIFCFLMLTGRIDRFQDARRVKLFCQMTQ